MRSQKDKQVAGLFIRKGIRGDTYNYAKNVRGKMVRASLGSTTMHSIAEARQWAHGLNQDAAGVVRTYTLGEVANKAVEKAERKGNRQPEYLRASLMLHAADWLARPLGEITKAMVNDRHDEVSKKSGPAAGARFVVVVRTLFNFADNNLDYAGRNPAKGVETAPSKPRQVVWSENQQAAFMQAAEGDDPYYADLFTVIAGTGMRRGNCCAMEWSEINGDTWTIPADKFKTGITHSVYLTPAVQQALARRKNNSRWVFPSPSVVDGSASLADPYSAFQRICAAAGVSGVTIHDLRRTLGSRLAAKVPLQVVAKVLGHRTINTTMRSYAVIADSVARDALMSLQTVTPINLRYV